MLYLSKPSESPFAITSATESSGLASVASLSSSSDSSAVYETERTLFDNMRELKGYSDFKHIEHPIDGYWSAGLGR